MLIGINDVIAWVETNGTPYWKVKDGAGEKAGLIFSAKPDDSSTIALSDSVAKLRGCLERLANGNYFIQAWETPGQKKEWNSIRFQITGSAALPPVGVGYTGPQQDVGKLIEEALTKERQHNKIERLEADLVAKEKRIKELEAEIDSAGHRISNRLEPLLAGFFGNEHGPNNNQRRPAQLGSSDDDTERIAQTMEAWVAADPEFETALNGIVKLATENPIKYRYAKSML